MAANPAVEQLLFLAVLTGWHRQRLLLESLQCLLKVLGRVESSFEKGLSKVIGEGGVVQYNQRRRL